MCLPVVSTTVSYKNIPCNSTAELSAGTNGLILLRYLRTFFADDDC